MEQRTNYYLNAEDDRIEGFKNKLSKIYNSHTSSWQFALRSKDEFIVCITSRSDNCFPDEEDDLHD